MLKKYFLILSLIIGILLVYGFTDSSQVKKGDKHPKVDWEIGCQECHKDATPEVYVKWEASRHGEVNFGCYMCHGDGQEVFYKKGKDDRCDGCHSNQAADMKKTKNKSCFNCHNGHSLKFHN